MSFTDFLRFHWVPAEGGNQQLVQPNNNDRLAARNVPPPLNLDLPQQPNIPNIHNIQPNNPPPPERQLTPRRRVSGMSINKVHVHNNLRRTHSNRTSKSDGKDSKGSSSTSHDVPDFISISSNNSSYQPSLHSKEPADYLMKVDSLDTKHTQRLHRSSSMKQKSGNDSTVDASTSPLEDSFCNSSYNIEELSPAMEEGSEFNSEENDSEEDGVLVDSPLHRTSHFPFGFESENVSDQFNSSNVMDDKDIIQDSFAGAVEALHQLPLENMINVAPEPIEPPQPLPPIDNVRNNDLGFNFEDFGNDAFDPADAQEVGMEVRIALFDLFGLEGSFYIMMRNAFWLLGFIGLFMLTFFSLPYVIGLNLTLILGRYYPFIASAFETAIPLKIRQIIEIVFKFLKVDIRLAGTFEEKRLSWNFRGKKYLPYLIQELK